MSNNNNKKTVHERDLSAASDKMRDGNKQDRSEGAQTLSLARWENEYKRQAKSRSVSGSRTTRRR